MSARTLIPVLLCLLLTGCTGTDIRGRISPDLLAADPGPVTRFAAHGQSDAVITASAGSPLLMPDALEAASGLTVSPGHVSLLLLGGSPSAVLPDYLHRQWIAPTCMVLYCPRGACAALAEQTAPPPEQIEAAVRTGLLPCRTADTVLGDLWGGSGITALHTDDRGRLRLMISDGSTQLGMLSEQAARGLALLGRRWSSFRFSAESRAFEVIRTQIQITVTQNAGTLYFAVTGKIFCRGDNAPETAGRTLNAMLLSALTESAQQYGADLVFLREHAIRFDIPEAAECPQAKWREMLQNAQFQSEVTAVCGEFR